MPEAGRVVAVRRRLDVHAASCLQTRPAGDLVRHRIVDQGLKPPVTPRLGGQDGFGVAGIQPQWRRYKLAEFDEVVRLRGDVLNAPDTGIDLDRPLPLEQRPAD